MRAARFHEYGGPEVLRIEEVPVPPPRAGEVLVQVAATSFNPVDAAIRAGLFRDRLRIGLPATPGLDVSGTVAVLGAQVQRLAAGDRVVGYLPRTAPGAAAEYVIAPAASLVQAPAELDLADGAALPLVALTAWQALFEYGHLEADQRVLINGAGGAVGSYAVQLAVRSGADVIAVVGAASRDRVARFGPEAILDRQDGAARLSISDPVDLVVNAAPTPIEELLPVTRTGGRVVSMASVLERDPSRDIATVRMASRSDAGQLRELVAAVAEGWLQVWVGDRRPLDEIAAVHEGPRRGETLLLPSPG